uniref:CCHC-type domain-containing protein n=1 Tax=Xenopus tropicalis TaxID=8364 RepID=A0A803JTA0_XENTR
MVKKITNEYGIWTGKRLFHVRLRDDESSEDGFDHPDQLINISGNRGFLKYNGMPLFCWKRCRQYGHLADGCTFCQNCGKTGHEDACPEEKMARCNKCGKPGHLAAACQMQKTCNMCGKEGHVYKDCPSKAKSAVTYADKVRMLPARSESEQKLVKSVTT